MLALPRAPSFHDALSGLTPPDEMVAKAVGLDMRYVLRKRQVSSYRTAEPPRFCRPRASRAVQLT